jgi:ATP-dependent helicase HrpA
MSEPAEPQSLPALRARLDACMASDRHGLRRRIQGLEKRYSDQGLRAVEQDLEASVARRERREKIQPVLDWPDLPVVEHLDELRRVVDNHQIVIVAGETGSGKTTQLPKLCLELGRGRAARIGHTQPRRLAARSVAQRLAEELQAPLGEQVGFKVRFQEQVSEDSLVKIMTDGMLLTEMQGDRFLDQYDTLIIDEAHERSLNIDFLLGYLKKLLPKRPDLKVIITSATIDEERFAQHFDDAPVVRVSGRTHPVEVRYRPPADDGDADLAHQVEDVLHEIETLEREEGRPRARDVLVFLTGERDIREVHHHLKKSGFADTEFLPLYARLSRSEQNRVFQSHQGRRVVLSTNVAETSLTVPGIRYVIDAGKARISRYSVHSKVQRLPEEPIARASADQRAGRCGRIMPGICFRLYSEDDYYARPEYTDPEIRRTNLASVILSMADLRLGRVEDFPFIDPPDGRLIRDGYRLLEELGAMGDKRKVTKLGQRLAKLPVDPRLGRMLLAASEKGVLEPALVVVSALSVQDPRERPPDKQQQADQAHQPFTDKDSDFVFFLNLWEWAEQQRQDLSRNQLEKKLKKNFLSPLRMREWRDTHRQLRLLCRDMKLNTGGTGDYEKLHRSLLTGLLGQVVRKTDDGDWLSTRNRKPVIWPGSSVARTKRKWLMAAELVETSRLFARTVAVIQPEWVEAEGAHLLKRQYYEPHWSKKRGSVMAKEEVSLFGLVVAAGRRVQYGHVDPDLAREIMIREGLVAGEVREKPAFLEHNEQKIRELEDYEHKLRRRDILAGEEEQVAFYQARLPDNLYTLTGLLDWYRNKAGPAEREALEMSEDVLLARTPELDADAYPDTLTIAGLTLPVEYRFDPEAGRDGATLRVPVEVLNQVPDTALEWLVPGLLREKLETLLRGLPKARRRHFVPVPDFAQALMETLTPATEPLLPALTRELQRMTDVRVEQEEWPLDELPAHLRFHVRVVDGDATLAESTDLGELRARFADQAREAVATDAQAETLAGADWCFDTLPPVQEVERAGVTVRLYPGLLDRGRDVALEYWPDAVEADWHHRWGVARLLLLRLPDQTRALRDTVKRLPGFQKAAGEFKELAEDALLRLAADHFGAGPDIRDDQSFYAALSRHRSNFVHEAETRLENWSRWLVDYRRLRARLDKDFPLAWAHAHRDLKDQLNELFHAGFLLDVPADWLQRYPRYLEAIDQRLERLGGRIGQDRSAVNELETFREQYQRRAGDRPLWQQPEPLVTFRFMLEEYRVSLFAQQLGTRVSVSPKRLRKQWELC